MSMPRLLRAMGVLAVFLLGSALGGSASAQSLRVVPLVEHWDGTSWTQVAAPSGGTSLDAVVAPAATDVWAFGTGLADGRVGRRRVGQALTNVD